MWDTLMGFLPNNLVLLCTILSFVIPYLIYKINQKLHEYGDPSWKKNNS